MSDSNSNGSFGCGGLGVVIAVVISWTANKSILWCMLHGFFGWFYVIYYAMGGGR